MAAGFVAAVVAAIRATAARGFLQWDYPRDWLAAVVLPEAVVVPLEAPLVQPAEPAQAARRC